MKVPFIPKDLRQVLLKKRVRTIVAIGAVLFSVGVILFITITARTPTPSFLFGSRPGPTPTPKNLWSPSQPTPIPLAHGKQTYMVSGGIQGVPQITEVTIDPIDPKPEETQTFSVTVHDSQQVTRVTATLFTDNRKTSYPLNRVDGDDKSGAWQGSWTIDGTYDLTYRVLLEAHNANRPATVTLTFR